MTELEAFKKAKDLMIYCFDTGVFTRTVTVSHNARKGQSVGSKASTGYMETTVGGKKSQGGRAILLHRLAYWWINDTIPKFIDHVNGIRDDNRGINIRGADAQENTRNCGVSKNSSTGVSGVCWHGQNNNWRAYITVDRRQLSLGSYSSFKDAVAARKKAEIKYFGEFIRS